MTIRLACQTCVIQQKDMFFNLSFEVSPGNGELNTAVVVGEYTAHAAFFLFSFILTHCYDKMC